MIVNALQRRADVIIQKSLAEGFGDGRRSDVETAPRAATRVGGIQDQVEDGISGVLVDDPTDMETAGRAVLSLLENRDSALDMGERARWRVRDHFLATRQLTHYSGHDPRSGRRIAGVTPSPTPLLSETARVWAVPIARS